jgi:hypothetical protein
VSCARKSLIQAPNAAVCVTTVSPCARVALARFGNRRVVTPLSHPGSPPAKPRCDLVLARTASAVSRSNLRHIYPGLGEWRRR